MPPVLVGKLFSFFPTPSKEKETASSARGGGVRVEKEFWKYSTYVVSAAAAYPTRHPTPAVSYTIKFAYHVTYVKCKNLTCQPYRRPVRTN